MFQCLTVCPMYIFGQQMGSGTPHLPDVVGVVVLQVYQGLREGLVRPGRGVDTQGGQIVSNRCQRLGLFTMQLSLWYVVSISVGWTCQLCWYRCTCVNASGKLEGVAHMPVYQACTQHLTARYLTRVGCNAP